MNPNVLHEDGIFRMVYRATNDVDYFTPGRYVSSIGYAESEDGVCFHRSPDPLVVPDREYERALGCEDPRVTKIEGVYLLYYSALGRSGHPRIALATSTDFKTFTKRGVVGTMGTRSKAAVLFPEKVGGQYVMFYTWRSDTPMSSILQVRFDSLDEVIGPPAGYMASNIDHFDDNVVFAPPPNTYRGAEIGAVPIKTAIGWLLIYCNANTTTHKEWTISAALLDLRWPGCILAESKEPILRPETDAERNGLVTDVTFPSGAVVVGDQLYVYYGSGDQGCCLATCDVNELLEYLESRIER